jgi:hypothetical protein
MPPPGREALDRIVQNLAELHGTITRESSMHRPGKRRPSAKEPTAGR